MAALVETRRLTKVYRDGTVALRDVGFSVEPGEIHGLLGENGAGKTTLTKILSGILSPTYGEIYVRGERVRFRSAAAALRRGIGMVHQHFALVPTFTPLENIVLGSEHPGNNARGAAIRAESRVRALMEEAGLRVPLDVPTETLSLGSQQRVEILKMLYRDVDLLILDEPTSALTPREATDLFQMLSALRDKGKSSIFITHKLREVLEITDRITVLRHGHVEGRVTTAEATPAALAHLMVGREVVLQLARGDSRVGDPILSVRNLWVSNDQRQPSVRGVTFDVRAGEIFGIAGIEGNGQTELVEALGGLRRPERGEVLINGAPSTHLHPRELYRRGMAHVPEDRRKLGLVLDFSVAENSVLGLHRERRFLGRIRNMLWARVREHTEHLIRRFEIVAPGVRARAGSLSGGNQQKLVVARELSKTPSLVIASQPTRGLDVAATEYIRRLLLELRDQGKALLLVSADLEEVLQLSDRVAVIYEGRIMGITAPGQATREQLGLMMGGIQVQLA